MTIIPFARANEHDAEEFCTSAFGPFVLNISQYVPIVQALLQRATDRALLAAADWVEDLQDYSSKADHPYDGGSGSLGYALGCRDASEGIRKLSSTTVSSPPIISVKTCNLSDDREDYFVSITVDGREVTPHVFRERYKAEYEVAHYKWIFFGGEQPDVMAYDETSHPNRRLK